MQKRYTKRQIEESIKYWKDQLKRIDESAKDEKTEQLRMWVLDMLDNEGINASKSIYIANRVVDFAKALWESPGDGQQQVNEGLFSWIGSLFSKEDKQQIDSMEPDAVKNMLLRAQDAAKRAYEERNWNKAGVCAIQAADIMNEAWSRADMKRKQDVAKIAVAIAVKLQYAKSNSSSEYACITFCNKLCPELQSAAKRQTSNELVKKCLSGWSGPDWKKSGRKGVPGTGWNYDPARDGWSYDDGY